MNALHFHTVVTYDGTHDITDHPSFTKAVERARQELLTERLLDSTVPRSKRRKYTRRDYIPGVYGEWLGTSIDEHAQPDIRIEVSACTPGLHIN